MLSSVTRKYRRCSQGLLQRGFATRQQGHAGSHQQGRRPLHDPPPPPTPPEKIEWWAVDGELFKAEKFDPKRVLAPLDNDHIPNRLRRKNRMKHLAQTRLKLKVHGQETYWAAYMKRFQAMRDEWERHVWNPIPVPVPKPRNPAWVAEEADRYVWKDARREAYTFDVSRMDYSGARSRFDNKIGYKAHGMSRYPAEGRRDAGGSSVRPGTAPSRGDTYKDSRPYDSARKDERYGHQRSTDMGRQNLRNFEYDNFEDVFDSRGTQPRGGGGGSEEAIAKKKTSTVRHNNKQAVLSTEDDEASDLSVEFSWEESDSDEEANGDDDTDIDEDVEEVPKSRMQRDRASVPPRRVPSVKEEDLFKDDN